MKIDELISELKEVKEEHGNLKIFVQDSELGTVGFDSIEVRERGWSIINEECFEVDRDETVLMFN